MVDKKPKTLNRRSIFIIIKVATLLLLVFVSIYFIQKQILLQQTIKENNILQEKTNQNLIAALAEIDRLNNEDPRKINNELKREIVDLKNIFKSTLGAYEDILYLDERGSKVTLLQSKYSSILNFLAKEDQESAQKSLDELTTEINKEKTRLASLAQAPISTNVPEITEAPTSGYRRQKVSVGSTSYLVDIVSADLISTKVIIDTASDETCTKDCPVLPLATYVSRSGAYAGINGTYFCPETYPSCVDKKNTFDVLVMNKNKVYFNSDNNVYSTVPIAIFSGNTARFIGQTSGWGRDTGVDAVIANRPLLILDGNNMFAGGGEEKEGVRSNRSFLGASGSTAYIGVVYGATVAEAAKVLHTMGIKNAINLDSGGSTALWSGGYKAGPGRNLPNVVLFVKK